MELTERERRILTELERQFDPGPTDHGPGERTRESHHPALRRALGPVAVLGAVLLAAGILLAAVGSAVLGGALLAGWVVTRHGRRLAVAGRWLAAGAAAGGVVPGCPPAPWWPTDGPR
ncbi:MAG TPA: DUF3040 domain-containing protein [Mycobacteriales bacterium]|nr:DUF3040 domain-containing protein [Mycobacteriales bacterium]